MTMYDASYHSDAAIGLRVEDSHLHHGNAYGAHRPTNAMMDYADDEDLEVDGDRINHSHYANDRRISRTDRDGGGVDDSEMLSDEEDGDYAVSPTPENMKESVLQGLTQGMSGAVGAGSRLLENGKRLFLEQRRCIRMGEGPTLLRVLCFIGGFCMFSSSFIALMNLFSLVTGPSTYVLQVYQAFFGIITMVVEAKDWDCLDQFKPWMTEWFRFLTVPAGKGAFYIFVGSLGVSLWVRHFLSFTVGLYMLAMGVICVAVHFGPDNSNSSGEIYREVRGPLRGDYRRQLTHQGGNIGNGGIGDTADGVGDALAEAFHVDPDFGDDCEHPRMAIQRHPQGYEAVMTTGGSRRGGGVVEGSSGTIPAVSSFGGSLSGGYKQHTAGGGVSRGGLPLVENGSIGGVGGAMGNNKFSGRGITSSTMSSAPGTTSTGGR